MSHQINLDELIKWQLCITFVHPIRITAHQINLDELTKWQLEEKALFASSSRENKRLYATLMGSYQVFSNNVLVLETMQPASAVDKYNSL